MCPNCGAKIPKTTPSFTKFPALDYILGVVAGFISLSIYGVGIVVLLMLAFLFRRESPSFYGGVCLVFILMALLFLGLLIACSGTKL
jgi:hypothetical protein